MARIRAGNLKHRLTIERPQTATDESGQTTVTGYETVRTVWASIEPLQGQEMMLARQINSETTHRIRMRACSEIKTSDRLAFGSRHFDISSLIDEDERGRSYEIMAIERDSER